MMKFFTVALCIFLTFHIKSYCQPGDAEDHFEGFRNAVSILPQYVSLSGLRIDYERKLNKHNQWLVIGPQYYSDKNGYDVYNKLSGAGLNAYFKIFLSQSQKKNENGLSRSTVYFSSGPTFQYFNLTSVEEVPEEFTENGTTYIRFNPRDFHTKIYKMGANADFGFQFAFDRFIFDLYLGMGIRFALDENGKEMDYFNDEWLDFGYSGILLDGGLRFGFFIP